MVSRVDAASALADLTEISSHVEAAAVLGADGAVVASTADDAGAERLARAGRDLLRVADERLGRGARTTVQVEAALRGGSVFALREGDRVIVARTAPRPPSALVLHDLGACLRDG
jgi:predicted regulator of Ras-like GTPase activity (Roadblock/LC7/MglB family)